MLLLLLLFDSPKTRKEINFEFAATIYHETKNARKKVLETFFKYWMLSYLIIHSKERKRYLKWYLRGWKKRGEQGATTLCINPFSIATLSIMTLSITTLSNVTLSITTF